MADSAWADPAWADPAWQSRGQAPWLFRPEIMVGAASPLWGYFTGAALAGASWWLMTRWLRPADLEILAEAAVEPMVEAVAEAESGLEAMAEAAVEPALEALAEAAGGPVAEALVSDEIPLLPVGGEAAPFGAAVLEAELLSDPELAKDLGQPPPRSTRSRKPRPGAPKPH